MMYLLVILFFGFQNELPDVAKPFQDDLAKQGRFEQFLKEKYHGGLRSKDSSGLSYMSEAAQARERLEFEAAAEAIRTGKCGKKLGFLIISLWRCL
ncbi:SWAP (Suppressor-of-White-APricot)/surp domain-containing protein [Actinidia rufa]|uniref:SWAP (Suppressor-of-White-APricot)/surp domain-containing protein n=1 Tax=Actinidia rufa TaxID=165716 RepID=A0A7J0G520_9ERIC|nr:SWAP (Suppressor-of-White-APricot)/surp domain-containing protein [Actinidia rufa]